MIGQSIFTCASVQQAQDIIDHLFTLQLIAGAEILNASLAAELHEVKVLLEHLESFFSTVQQEVAVLVNKSTISTLEF